MPVDDPGFGQSAICPDCDGGEVLAKSRARRLEKVSRLLAESGLTETARHAGLEWEHFTPESLLKRFESRWIGIELARSWAKGYPIDYGIMGADHWFSDKYPTAFPFRRTNSLWLYGEAGGGKTGLAYLAYKTRLARTGNTGIFIEWAALYEAIKGEYGKDSNQSYPLLDAVATAPILVLDDVGHARRSRPVGDDQADKLFQIVDRRYRHEYATIITSNLDRVGLRDQFDDKTVSRLSEMCVICEYGDSSLREVDQ